MHRSRCHAKAVAALSVIMVPLRGQKAVLVIPKRDHPIVTLLVNLLSLALCYLDLDEGMAAGDIVGAEWWVHTRLIGRDVGHQLHYDTEEESIRRYGRVLHPAVGLCPSPPFSRVILLAIGPLLFL